MIYLLCFLRINFSILSWTDLGAEQIFLDRRPTIFHCSFNNYSTTIPCLHTSLSFWEIVANSMRHIVLVCIKISLQKISGNSLRLIAYCACPQATSYPKIKQQRKTLKSISTTLANYLLKLTLIFMVAFF